MIIQQKYQKQQDRTLESVIKLLIKSYIHTYPHIFRYSELKEIHHYYQFMNMLIVLLLHLTIVMIV